MHSHFIIYLFFISSLLKNLHAKTCPQEVSTKGISVMWKESSLDTVITSIPLCYNKHELITRQCNSSGWVPPLSDLKPCMQTFNKFHQSSCPPGFNKVSKYNNKYCYKIGTSSSWNYPCIASGGGSMITEFSSEEFDSLLQSLRRFNGSQYYWLPAQRRKIFSPVVWNIPGPNWGQTMDLEELKLFSSLVKNCLILDIERGALTTQACNRQFPSICIYSVEFTKYPAKCPAGYYEFPFISVNDTCFGIEETNGTNELTFDDFTKYQCRTPMGGNKSTPLRQFIFMKLAEMVELPENSWCWFLNADSNTLKPNISMEDYKIFQGVINNNGTIGLMMSSTTLPCMACETKISYNGETALELEFSPVEFKLFLTIYFPSGLWKYDNTDIGVTCFSDAKGFFITIDIDDNPLLETSTQLYKDNINSTTMVEKTIYAVHLITNRSAQYWCEAHNKSFSLLASSKVIVNPTSNQLHVFALVIKVHLYDNETVPEMASMTVEFANLLQAEKVLLMEILDYNVDYLLVLLHIHVAIGNEFDDKASNMLATYHSLQQIVTQLPQHNYSFVNISSSEYCFPTTSYDYILLEWDLSFIGQIAAPKQFCLQSNGLPVKRHCRGSYLYGSKWGEVEGRCNETYEPSNTTTFLYNFVTRQVTDNCTSRFLIDGLGFVLDDVDIIIPADIYYLSMSFQTILAVAQSNDTSVDMGDIENMAWAMDRILLMDIKYLRLSQTFNSTNVILDSVSDIFERLAKINETKETMATITEYQLSVKPKFIVQISYPVVNNVTGIAISKSRASDSFLDMIVQPLYANSTIEKIASIKNLEVATWIPSNVLKSLQKISNKTDSKKSLDESDIHIVINIYYNDAIFQELDESKHEVNSRIVGLTIPGYRSNLIYPIPLLFRKLKETNNTNQLCGFWNFQSRNIDSNPGFWSKQGCYYEKSLNDLMVCHCYHMTHFGQLLDIGKPRYNEKSCNSGHISALNTITLVGSFLSLLGIVGIWMTALTFQTWRKKPSTKVLLQLSSAIALPLVFMVIFNLDNTLFLQKDGIFSVQENKIITCIILGSLLQYSILASFMWMLITAILQFIRYVRVLGVCRPSRFMCKFALVGWGLPLIPVILCLLFNYKTYVPDPTSNPEKLICYPSGIYLILGLFVPVCIILMINIILFLTVLISISHGPDGKMKTSDMDLTWTQLRLSLFLFFLLGLSWIFGLFSFSGNLMWSYLFCLTSTLQGFVLFTYFVICDPATRNLWVTLMKPQFRGSSSRKSISSISSG